YIHAYDPDIVFIPYPGLVTVNRQIKRSLTTHRRKDTIDIRVFVQNLDDVFLFEREEINMVCGDRVGHNGGRVGIDKGDSHSLFPLGAGRLRTFIIKFKSLRDDYWTTSDHQYMFDAVVFGHSLEVLCS